MLAAEADQVSPENLDSGSVTAPLDGVRVIEIGRFASGPSCATVLADWGADVVKLEPPSGDPARGPGSLASESGERLNPRFEVHNRSRRSLVLDLQMPAGRAAAARMLDRADVLVTNLSPGALDRLDLAGATLQARHPRLIIGQISGYDIDTAQGNDRSYDHGGYWAYSGAAALFASATGEPPQPAGGFGDRAAGSMLAGAISAALFARERTGRGTHITTSLDNTGMWLMASDVSDILTTGSTHRASDRRDAAIPTVNCFRTADGRWLWLQAMVPESEWQQLLTALDAAWLDDDPRFRGGTTSKLKAERRPLVELLDEVIRGRTMAEWAQRLTAHGITWAPVRSLEEAVNDLANQPGSAFVEVHDPAGAPALSVNTPCRFRGLTPPLATRAPHVGEHTKQVLAAYGFDAAEIEQLYTAGVVDATAEPAARVAGTGAAGG